MEVISYTEARTTLKSVIDRVIDDQDVTFIHRRDGHNAVILSETLWASWQETMHLLASPANVKALSISVDQYRKGQARKRELSNS
jgi:antitoxin YefM